MPEAKAELDLDVRGLDRASREAFSAYGRIIMADRNARAQIEKPSKGAGAFKFLEGENKVKKNLSGLTQELLSARSASEALTSAIVRVSEATKVGLAAGIGVGVGMAIKNQLEASADELNAFSDKWKESMNFSANGASESEMEAALERTKAVAEEARQKLEGVRGAWNMATGAADTYYAAQQEAESSQSYLQRKLSFERRTSRRARIAESDIAVTQAELAVDRNPEEIQRGALTSKNIIAQDRAAAAASAYDEARKGGAPQARVDKLGEESAIAGNEARKTAADLAKFEKETSKEKEFQLAMADAAIDSMKAQIAGNRQLADNIERGARAEESIKRAVDSGNTALASRLRIQSALSQQQANIQNMAGADGRPKTQGQLNREARIARQQARRYERAEKRDFENYGLSRVNRDSSGQITGGIDRATGKYREITEEDRKKHEEERVAREGGAAQEARKKEDTIRGSKFEEASSHNGKSGDLQNQGNDINAKLDQIIQSLDAMNK